MILDVGPGRRPFLDCAGKRSDDGAFAPGEVSNRLSSFQSGVALRLPPHSKSAVMRPMLRVAEIEAKLKALS